jgi:hypothetical protein
MFCVWIAPGDAAHSGWLIPLWVIWLLHQALVAFDSARLNRHAPPAHKGLD